MPYFHFVIFLLFRIFLVWYSPVYLLLSLLWDIYIKPLSKQLLRIFFSILKLFKFYFWPFLHIWLGSKGQGLRKMGGTIVFAFCIMDIFYLVLSSWNYQLQLLLLCLLKTFWVDFCNLRISFIFFLLQCNFPKHLLKRWWAC